MCLQLLGNVSRLKIHGKRGTGNRAKYPPATTKLMFVSKVTEETFSSPIICHVFPPRVNSCKLDRISIGPYVEHTALRVSRLNCMTIHNELKYPIKIEWVC